MQGKEEMEALVAAARGQDSTAFTRLYEMLYQDMYRTAYYILGNCEDAENAVSDAVLDAYAGLGKLRDNGAFRAWIFAILTNKCRRYQRAYVKNRESISEKPVEEYSEMLGDQRDSYKEAEDRVLTEILLGRLTQEEREIVTLTVFGECDSGEVARLLSLNRNTVRSKYSRALQKMKAAFGGMT